MFWTKAQVYKEILKHVHQLSTLSILFRFLRVYLFVEGRGFHVEGEGTMSRVEDNIFFSNFLFLEKVIIRRILNSTSCWVGEGGGGGIEKSSGTSQFVFEELHL